MASGMTTKTQHTPGPWITEPGPDGIDVFADNGSDPATYIATVWGVEEQEGNAALIAAAPQTRADRNALLAAAKAAELEIAAMVQYMQQTRNQGVGDLERAGAALRAAVEQAEGNGG